MSIPAKPTLTPPPAAPVRGEERLAFADKANARVAWQGTNTTEMTAAIDWQNTVFTAVETEPTDAADSADSAAAFADSSADSAAASADSAAASEAVALSSANYKGEWSALTGSAAIPYSASNNGKFWQLINNLADVTTSEPGVTGDWIEIVFSDSGGATTTSSATDITLDSDSDRVQVVSMTASDLSVTLPDATTLTTGGPLYVIRNAGGNTFAVLNAAGGPLAFLLTGQIAVFYCTDISTSAGVWVVGNEAYNGQALPDLLAGIIATINAVSSDYTSVAMLTSTKAICTYRGTSNYLQTVILDVSGSTITAGSVLLLTLFSPATSQ